MMIDLKATLIKRPPSPDKIIKNVRFGIAVGLTKTAKQGQAAVIEALRGAFTLRGGWYKQHTPFGIKVKPADKNDLTLASEVRTNADWLERQRTGGTFFPYHGNFFAVPTKNVWRTKRQIIPQAKRPKNLKKTVVIKTKSGVSVIFQRKGRGRNSDLVAMYTLIPRKKIKAVDTFYEPITKVLKRRRGAIIQAEIRKALATMR